MPAFPFLAAASMVPAAYQFIAGLKQTRQAGRMNPVRPTAALNASTTAATGIAQNLANAGMAGYGQAIGNVRQNTASTVRAAQESGSANNALAVIAAAGANENQAVGNLDVQNAKFRQSGQQFLAGQLNRQAGEEQRVWDWNTRQKYLEQAATKSALTQAGAQNTNNALGGLAAAIVMGARNFTRGSTPGAAGGADLRAEQIRAQMDDDDYDFTRPR